ncbi:hypothetical protein BR93DRAFT_923290 [Coniochaeta sp. PMI_546]|nr:hypothetical protein BR93DRAFT_923290 [Coniochaeta sp. PMI_546]
MTLGSPDSSLYVVLRRWTSFTCEAAHHDELPALPLLHFRSPSSSWLALTVRSICSIDVTTGDPQARSTWR